jgi:hypothetical protein
MRSAFEETTILDLRGQGLVPLMSTMMMMRSSKRGRRVSIIPRRRRKGEVLAPHKDEFNAIIETKKTLVAERKHDKEARWNELKALKQDKW